MIKTLCDGLRLQKCPSFKINNNPISIITENGDVLRLFESEEISKPKGRKAKGNCYEGTDYKNGGPEYQYTRCW